MSNDVIDMTSRRPPPSDDDALLCECGSGWFRLVPIRHPDGTFGAGTVVIDRDLSITGWSGALLCAECHAELKQANP